MVSKHTSLVNNFQKVSFLPSDQLELSCCKKWQKSRNQETGFGNRGRLNDTKLVLNEHE